MLCFQDSKLPSKDIIEKNLGLYIPINVDGIYVKNALVDVGSNINICSVDLLQKYFPSIYASMKRTNINIKGFDNTKNECTGYVTMPIEVGGKLFIKEFMFFKQNRHIICCLVNLDPCKRK